MTADIVGIGKMKKKHPPAESLVFENLHEYLRHAKRMIGYFARGSLGKQMLASEDAISNVATAIMFADWTWDENYTGKRGQKCSKHTYRNLRGIWAIKSYLVRQKRKSKNKINSINTSIDEDGTQLCSILEGDYELPIQNILKSELRELLEDVISCGIITDQQEKYIRAYYFDSMSYSEIARKNGISRQAVHDGVNRAIKSLEETLSSGELK
tara:strand:- start:2155 stop:2790 length:636 start_codon:yes stop_codon:yes gene_type:complete